MVEHSAGLAQPLAAWALPRLFMALTGLQLGVTPWIARAAFMFIHGALRAVAAFTSWWSLRDKYGFHVMVESPCRGGIRYKGGASRPTRHTLLVTRSRKRRAGGKGAEVRRVFGVSRNVVYRFLSTLALGPGGLVESS